MASSSRALAPAITPILMTLGLVSGLAVTPALSGNAAESVYTTFDTDKCHHEPGTEEEDYGSWTCPGYAGLKVLLSAGDERMYVTFGTRIANEDLASTQTFPAFNDVYRGTVEWRVEKAGGKPRPFATILRWNVVRGSGEDTSGPPPTGSVLVVTRLGPGGVCHVGYVDATVNPNANALAHQIADDRARTFTCGEDKPIVAGQVGPGLRLPRE